MNPQVPMIDVSANNHLADESIQWARVRHAGYRAVMIKCSEGTDYVNPWRVQDARAADEVGLDVGYYHFARPGLVGAESEAKYALEAIRGLPRSLGLALDLEVTEGLDWRELADWARTFHKLVLQDIEHSPLYTPPSFLDAMPGAPWGYRLWLPSTDRPRRQVWAWQMTRPVLVPGIAVPTDVGYLHPDT